MSIYKVLPQSSSCNYCYMSVSKHNHQNPTWVPLRTENVTMDVLSETNYFIVKWSSCHLKLFLSNIAIPCFTTTQNLSKYITPICCFSIYIYNAHSSFQDLVFGALANNSRWQPNTSLFLCYDTRVAVTFHALKMRRLKVIYLWMNYPLHFEYRAIAICLSEDCSFCISIRDPLATWFDRCGVFHVSIFIWDHETSVYASEQ